MLKYREFIAMARAICRPAEQRIAGVLFDRALKGDVDIPMKTYDAYEELQYEKRRPLGRPLFLGWSGQSPRRGDDQLVQTHEHPVVLPHVSHFMQVPFRTRVKFPHSPHISPS